MNQFDIRKHAISLLLLISLILVPTGCAINRTLDRDPELNIKFGLEAAKGGLWKEAILRWENALKLSPNSAKVHNNLAIAYENEGDYVKAEEHYKRALELDPGNDSIKINYNSFKGFLKRQELKETDQSGEVNDAK